MSYYPPGADPEYYATPRLTDDCCTPDCIVEGPHYADECHTARDAAIWAADQYGAPLPLWVREPFYRLHLLWSAIRWHDKPAWQALHFHWHCELAYRLRLKVLLVNIKRLLPPKRCPDCGKRWKQCPGECLPF